MSLIMGFLGFSVITLDWAAAFGDSAHHARTSGMRRNNAGKGSGGASD